MSTAQTGPTLRVMPREMRLMSERIFSMTGLPKGFFMAVQDVVMYSQKLDLGGFAMLEERFPTLRDARPDRISIASEDGAKLCLDGGGQHAWSVLPALIDLLGELVARFGEAEISVVNALDPEELRIAEALGGRTGLAVNVIAGTPVVLTAEARPVTGDVGRDDPLLWDVLTNGVQIDAELWWRIYHLAKKALTPDSVVSRRHAGPMIVNQDGTVIGRKDNDDETDISFLMSPRSTETEAESTKQ
ncbi:hypothetical protein [Aquamicrobium sp. LC103]|uniref:hypothetical protein n=1 Tax=Aquamicrobium sp. LC103 TaxID=1120658 RepID=UPI00063E8AC0|nr:hypothetical protein [Aquamicrobium sp. LC103]TKT74697.1 hypothetical protein XW59_022475 [Aquamicrobium sp. LC103]